MAESYAKLRNEKNDQGFFVVEQRSIADAETAEERGLVKMPRGGPGWWYDPDAETFRPPITPVAERKNDMREQVENRLNRAYEAGFDYDFAANTSANKATLPDGTTEAAGTRTIQMQSAFDRSQWSAVAQTAKSLIDVGNPDSPMRPIRTKDNARVTVTAQEAFDAMMALQAWAGRALERQWDLKDQIDTAVSHADLDAIDPTTGWR